jgi:hypothetical protein
MNLLIKSLLNLDPFFERGLLTGLPNGLAHWRQVTGALCVRRRS